MKQYVLTNSSGLSGLVSREAPRPEPDPGQVLLRVKAVSLNYRDIMIATGTYGQAQFPRIPASDGTGLVEAVGSGVTLFKPGDRVAGIFMQRWQSGEFQSAYAASSLGGQIDGIFSEYVTLPENGLVPIPEHLSFEEAATLPCAAVTAWNALFESGNLRPGQSLLVQGTGGVSIFALQFAKLAGAKVIVTSSSDAKLERARALGADQTINYTANPEWQEEVSRLTQSAGVDQIIEVGGAGTFSRSLQSVKAAGRISVVGILSGAGTEVRLTDLIRRSVKVDGIYVGSRSMFENMNRMVTVKQLRPIIDKVFPYEQAREAYEYQMSGAHFGKVVIQLP